MVYESIERDLKPVQLFFVQAQEVRKNDLVMTNNFDVGMGNTGRCLESAKVFDCVKDVVPQTHLDNCVRIVGSKRDWTIDKDAWLIIALYAGG